MTPISLSSGEYLLVEVPEDGKHFWVSLFRDYSPALLYSNGTDPQPFIQLPYDGQEGKYWTIIGKGRGNSITEEEWKGIVEGKTIGEDTRWRDFTDFFHTCKTATSSGLSLIKSHGFEHPEKVLILKKK